MVLTKNPYRRISMSKMDFYRFKMDWGFLKLRFMKLNSFFPKPQIRSYIAVGGELRRSGVERKNWRERIIYLMQYLLKVVSYALMKIFPLDWLWELFSVHTIDNLRWLGRIIFSSAANPRGRRVWIICSFIVWWLEMLRYFADSFMVSILSCLCQWECWCVVGMNFGRTRGWACCGIYLLIICEIRLLEFVTFWLNYPGFYLYIFIHWRNSFIDSFHSLAL